MKTIQQKILNFVPGSCVYHVPKNRGNIITIGDTLSRIKSKTLKHFKRNWKHNKICRRPYPSTCGKGSTDNIRLAGMATL